MSKKFIDENTFDELFSRSDRLDLDFSEVATSLESMMTEIESHVDKAGRNLGKKINITKKTKESVTPNFEVNRIYRRKRMRIVAILFLAFQVFLIVAAITGGKWSKTTTETDTQPTVPPAFEQPIEKPDILNKL